MAQAQVSNTIGGYAGAADGGWSGGANPDVTGPSNGGCANIGNIGSQNATSNYGFSIPMNATVTDVNFYVDATAGNTDEMMQTQLASDASAAPYTLIGTSNDVTITGLGGNCASAMVHGFNFTLADWGTNSGTVTPAVVNSPNFGIVFTTLQSSSIKIDSNCLEIEYTTPSGTATQLGCFTVPFTVNKDFSDDNPAQVEITLSCTNADDITANPLMASEGNPAVFGVRDENGDATCTASETAGLPAGYTKDESDCQTPQAADGGECTIVNTANTPSWMVTKTVTNMGTGAGGAFQAGDTINYTIDVTNDGTVTITNVVVSDPLLGLMNAVCSASLAPAASCQVMGSYMVTQADIDNNGGGDGDIDNTATANSDNIGPTDASASAMLVAQNASKSMTKTVTNTGSGAGGLFAAGDTVMYTIEVTNDGNVTLTNVVVNDVLLGLTNEPCSASLAPGGSCQVMGSYMVTQGDIDNNGGGDGDIDNTATADSDQAQQAMASAEADLVAQDPSLAVSKTVTNTGSGAGGTFAAGDTIMYTIEVTNDGNVTLTNVVVSDALLGLTNEPCSASLAPGGSCQVMGSYMVTQGDIDNNGGGDGDIDNTAEADSDQAGPQQGMASAPLEGQDASLAVSKTITNTGSGAGGSFDAGDTIMYTIEVTNDGNVTLTNVVVSDALLGLTNEPCSASLAPGGSCQVMGSYMVTQGDIDNNGGGDGDIDNTAEGNSDQAGPQQASAEAPLVQVPSLTVTKSVTNTGSGAGGAFAAGDTIMYTIEVTNDGNVDLNNVVVSDPLLGLTNESCSATLAPAASCQVMGTYMVTQGDIDDNGGGDGDIDNTADASSDEAGPQQASAAAPLVAQDPSIAVTKTITNSGTGAGGDFQPGDTVNYDIVVTNDGNVTLTNVVVSDALLGLTNEPCSASLAPGAMCTVMGSYMVTQDDLDNNGGGDGDIDNTAEADSDQAGPQQASAAAPLIAQDPDITLVKSADPVTYTAVGDVINYTFDVTNSGNITLYDVIVSDPLIEDPPNNGTISCPGGNPIPMMAPGAMVSCSGSYTITQEDLDSGSVSNTATAEGCSVPRGGDGGVGGDCQGVTAMDDAGAVIAREFLDATFRVTKDFSDDNPANVTVFIDCNTGLPLHQQAQVGEFTNPFDFIEFIVQDFEPGTMDCDIYEDIPAGYVPDYEASLGEDGSAGAIFTDEEGCHFEEVAGGRFSCEIFNDLQPVDVVVEKEWIDENPEYLLPQVVEVTLQCSDPIVGGFPCIGLSGENGGNCAEQFIDPANPGEFQVFPHYEGTTCIATEEPLQAVVTDESDCEELILFPGQGDSCVIVNTRLYAGIPTLSQYGLMLMALLMLGFGAVAYRRFA